MNDGMNKNIDVNILDYFKIFLKESIKSMTYQELLEKMEKAWSSFKFNKVKDTWRIRLRWSMFEFFWDNNWEAFKNCLNYMVSIDQFWCFKGKIF